NRHRRSLRELADGTARGTLRIFGHADLQAGEVKGELRTRELGLRNRPCLIVGEHRFFPPVNLLRQTPSDYRMDDGLRGADEMRRDSRYLPSVRVAHQKSSASALGSTPTQPGADDGRLTAAG